jgi:putative FmdB family regulatory protein
MPTYQYACKNADCGNRFELVQSFSDPAASECPSCGGAVRKVFGAVGVVFKGSGFYRTDSRSDSRPAPTTSDAKGSGSAEKKAEPAAKPAEKKPAATGSGSAGKAAATA